MATDPKDAGDGQDFEQFLRGVFGGAGAAGLPLDPAQLGELFASMRRAAQSGGSGTIDWTGAEQQAAKQAQASQVVLTDAERSAADEAGRIAALWLTEATELTPPTDAAVMSRTEWVSATMPFWERICEPIVGSIANTLRRSLDAQAPEQLKPMLQQAGSMLQALSSTVFGMQLGTVVGDLSGQIVSANEIGVPTERSPRAALLPQNVQIFTDGLDGVPEEQTRIYLAARELAHVALFRAAPWLTGQLELMIRRYAEGIPQVISQIEVEIDPSDPEGLRRAIESGALIPPPSAAQQQATAQLETLLTLIEGWVNVVTTQATARLPKAAAIAEMYNRRRAEGGPAEQAFGSLVHLEFRPRRLRQATTLWTRLTDRLGPSERDHLWQHPDILPGSEDLDDPQTFLIRYTAEDDELDDDLQQLLDGTLTAPAPTDEDEPDARETPPSDGHPGTDGPSDPESPQEPPSTPDTPSGPRD
ncbi:MAG: zinc-dependent metalloprotease [Microbacteriaceae bacterium]|jgi:putative hydrolase|nr:zinc-dependent metalloprotease [Microbacteriaceae bacterium]MCI1207217.1 zinc-dependent metalloprotease [Microbacteriaceae bacterium]